MKMGRSYMKYIDKWIDDEIEWVVETDYDCDCETEDCGCHWYPKFKTGVKEKIREAYHRGQRTKDDANAYQRGRVEVAEVIMEFVGEIRQDSETRVR